MRLPDLVVERVQAGKTRAPSLREIVETDGTRYAVLDFIVEVPVEPPVTFEEIDFDWGVRVLLTASVVDLDGNQIGRPFFLNTGPFDGRQARLRRQIDQLKATVARLETQRNRFPVGDPRRNPSEKALPLLRREISRCWRKYEARNNDLAHLAATILLVLATAFDCKLIAGESLKSMKSAGRGRGARGAGAIGETIPRCAGNSGGGLATNVAFREFALNGSNPAIPRMSVRAVATPPTRTHLLTIATRSMTGEPGSAALIPNASGMGPEIMLLPSISPAWAQL